LQIEELKRSLENAATGVPFSTSTLQDHFPAQVSWDDVNDNRPDLPPKPQVTPPAKKKSRRRLGGNAKRQAAVRSPRANSVACSSSSTLVSSMESPPIASRTPKRKAMVDDNAASLLLHFSRQNTPGEEKKMRIAAV
jgi:hypothetical protein